MPVEKMARTQKDKDSLAEFMEKLNPVLKMENQLGPSVSAQKGKNCRSLPSDHQTSPGVANVDEDKVADPDVIDLKVQRNQCILQRQKMEK